MSALLFIAAAVYAFVPVEMLTPHIPRPVFEVRSVDTMKYSRDMAKSESNNDAFNDVIDRQVKSIADINATHVAISTPYEEEFAPFLTKWVSAARKYGLNVWFRGNVAGWEKWFGYAPVSREEHISQVTKFITTHGTLFEDGDIFTPCPECENGGPGDPRSTGDVDGFRAFLIDERKATLDAFKEIRKDVRVDVQSMNYDVANLIMDKETTAALGGIVGIDHYIKDPKQLARDVDAIAEKSGGKVYLAEYGAPIPDIHGDMTEEEQAEWIRSSLEDVVKSKHIAGINYWVSVGGSTEIWNGEGKERKAVSVLKDYYTMLK